MVCVSAGAVTRTGTPCIRALWHKISLLVTVGPFFSNMLDALGASRAQPAPASLVHAQGLIFMHSFDGGLQFPSP